jgi:hypothetical protein
MDTENAIRLRFLAARDHLDERQRRIFAASEARALGYGGMALVARATAIAPSTIARGLLDLDEPPPLLGTIRRPGAGRPFLAEGCPTLLSDLRSLVEPATMGDPMRALLWVSKSHEKLAAALQGMGHTLCANTVGTLLEQIGFRRQANRKTREGASHPDRDAQFEYINAQAVAFEAQNEPVISVDTKKKEILGDFKNGGSDYRATGCPDLVRTHDFMDKELGKAIPHGIYDVSANAGWVTVGIDHDTAEFAVNSLRFWWEKMGCIRYPHATRLLITADGGGSKGSRLRLWKRELQNFVEETRLSVTVCHYPPGTSKWNKIEHRLFCQISQNWRGQPLTSRLAIVELIGSTKTTTGLTVRCELDPRTYAKAIQVSVKEFDSLNIERAHFHPDWNYTIHPRIRDTNSDHAAIVA